MLSKFLLTLNYFFLQSESNKQQAEELMKLQSADDLSRLTSILSIALITILLLLTLSLYKSQKLSKENADLRKQLNQ